MLLSPAADPQLIPKPKSTVSRSRTFLDAGQSPAYFGFGSIRAPQDLSKNRIKATRALGRRAIVSRGRADLSLVDNEPRLHGHR
jgi:vancomycin aglycone glucosyltransferase